MIQIVGGGGGGGGALFVILVILCNFEFNYLMQVDKKNLHQIVN